MDQATHNKIVSFIWGIADDVLRDLFRRGKYPDVILPMCVLRRLDAVLEPTKKAVLETRKMLDDADITEQSVALCSAAGQAFYNTSKFTLRDLKSRGSQQQLLSDFEDYLNGFSPNVQDILENFKFRNQLSTLSKADALGTLISKFLDPEIDLTPAGIDNHSMGTVFEELVRKFNEENNEENNEEAGEHWTPRDAVRLMTNLVFRPIAKELKSGTYLLYDCACGTGGILTEGEELSLVTRTSDGQMLFLANMVSKMQHDTALGSRIAEVHNGSSLFTGDAGQGESNIRRWIIENDWLEAIVALPLNLFYNTGIATYIWVLSNRKPKNRKGQVQLIDASKWFKPLRKNLGKKNCELAPDDIERITQTFLKFKETPESKIFPNEAFGYWKVIVERPLRLHSQLSLPRIESLRFASGDEEIRSLLYNEFGDDLFRKFSKITAALEKHLNEWSADDEEPDDEEEGAKKKGLPEKTKRKLLDPKTWERDGRLVETATRLREEIGGKLFEDHNVFREKVFAALWKLDIKLPAADLKQLYKAVSWREESAPPVIGKVHKPGKSKPYPHHGLYELPVDGKNCVIEYETDSDLRDSEQIPLLEQGGIEAFIRREVLPYTADAWVKKDATKIGYEVSFTRHFYQPPQLRTLAEISSDILALEKETDGLLSEITKGATA